MPTTAAAHYPAVDYRPRYPGEIVAAAVRDLKGATERIEAQGAAAGADVVRVGAGGGRSLVWLRHPDLVRSLLIDHDDGTVKPRGLRLARGVLGDGLLSSEPPAHTRRRRLVLPAFHHGRLRAYGRVMTDLAGDEADGWPPGVPFDVAASMARLTLAVASRTLFGADVDRRRIGAALAGALAAFDRAQHPLGELFARLPLPNTLRTRRARAAIDGEVYRVIAAHRAAGDPGAGGGDLLDLLLAARDDETGGGLTDQEVRDEAVTLLLAGHETTAVALTWTWALLAQHPDAQARLSAEAEALDGPPTADDLSRLPYARGVFAEAMRLYPPAWSYGREAARPLDLAGVAVAPGTTVLFGPLWLHSDPRFWTDPGRFDPDRWTPERRAERHKFAYLPFSAGRRGCIGEQFAWMEGVLVLATVARRWRLSLAGPVPAAHGSVTLRPSGPVRMVPHART